MDKWTELKTAYHVARLGTISEAARYLSIHRATVIRHIDAVEQDTGQKLFIRNRKGYVPTDLGVEILRIGSETEAKISDILGVQNRKQNGLHGDLIITSIDLIVPMLIPAVNAYHAAHPDVIVKCLPGFSKLNLDYGEAHIAIRSGPEPDEPDCVVRKFCKFSMGIYAHKKYVEQYGQPKDETDFAGHRFVGISRDVAMCDFDIWLQEHVPEKQFIFISSCHKICEQAVEQGEGIGFHIAEIAQDNPELVEIISPRSIWDIQFWWLTHGDIHHSEKIQSFISLIKSPSNQPRLLRKVFNM